MSIINQSLDAVDTPNLIVDLDRLHANIQRFAKSTSQANVKLRPHIKTHKTIEIAQLQRQAGAHGITTAKLSEAEVYANAGFDNIFVAYPIIGQDKAQRAAQLARRCHLIVGVESAYGIQQLSAAASAADTTLSVRLEIDSGLQRTGVLPSAALDLCQLIVQSPHLYLDGIFTYRSTNFPNATSTDPHLLGQLEGSLMVELAQQLRASGIPIHEISVGSTPTGLSTATVPGITEVRPGTYVFFDRMTTHSGTSSPSEVALTILATVISRPTSELAIIDAGSKTFCGDIVPSAIGLEGYAITTSRTNNNVPNGTVIRMNEEHGIVRLASGFSPNIGDKLLFIPNHVCTTVNLSDELIVTQDNQVVAIWPVTARGRRL